MKENQISGMVVGAALEIHKEIGPGLLESVYEAILADALSGLGLKVERQKSIPISYRGKIFEDGFRADLVVEDFLIIEIKSVEKLPPVHKKQLFTYVKLSGKKVGLLINFDGELLKGNVERIVVGVAPDLRFEKSRFQAEDD